MKMKIEDKWAEFGGEMIMILSKFEGSMFRQIRIFN